MTSVLKGAKVAILKPNFVAGRGAETGSTTSFALLKAVAEEVQACGAEPVLCEMPGTEFDREATYTILGIEQFCAANGIRILRIDPEGDDSRGRDLKCITPRLRRFAMRYATSPLCLACGYRKEDASLVANARRIYPARDWVELRPAGAKKLRRFSIPRILNEACLINLPVLKTHVVSTMTLAMKNPMGILPRPDRRSMHTLGIDQCIVDMNRAIKPGLTIVDGSVGQDGEGPLYGDKADLQVLVAGRDSLAVDLVCCQLVGVKPRDIPHLKLALEQLGKPSWTLVGEEVGVIKKFRLPAQKPLYRFIFWMMYPLDYPYNWIAGHGKHFCTLLYSTGLVGTRPQIKEESCTRCGICVEACPLPNVIDLKSLQVNYSTCQRCLLCYDACPENAISVKGYSGARQ